MKARVKATGEIVEVREEYDLREAFVKVFYSNEEDPYEVYEKEALEFDVKEKSFLKNSPDYWTRLEHQYAGMAMQGLMSYIKQITTEDGCSYCDAIVDFSAKVAHALVEKYKKEEK